MTFLEILDMYTIYVYMYTNYINEYIQCGYA